MSETIEEFKARINEYNKLHGLIDSTDQQAELYKYDIKPAKYKKSYDSHCLYCGKYEKGHPDTVDYICSNCVSDTTRAEKEELHKEACKNKQHRRVKALEIFSHVGGNNDRPKRRRRSKRKRLVR